MKKLNKRISDIKLDKAFTVELDLEDVDGIDFMPIVYSMVRIEGELMKVTPADDLNDEIFLLQDIEEYPLLQMAWTTELLNITIKLVKTYSERTPVFELESKKNYFKYSLFLSGKTVEEIINKLTQIYQERRDMLPDNNELRKRITNN